MYRFSGLFILLTLLSLISCAVSTVDPAVEAEPEWMSTPPSDDDFYYGIGGSSTGNEAEDREIAISRAQSNLAASISVDIISELELSNTVAADGSSKETLESRIQQSVSQSLVNLEAVDNWFHPDRGYWVLYRMNRQDWEAQRKADRRVSVPVPSGVAENSGYNIPFIAILTTKDLPLQLLPGGRNTPYEITLDWVVSDFPVLEESGGIHFSRLSGVVSFKQYGLVLFSREYGPVKEGGLNYEQARERAALKVLEAFRADSSFDDEIQKVLAE
ncbi:MAG: LPP20 family lipoprotein [Spirochaetales bacterium]|nr:LPP20 family lipoprotein [Spirochaetales bacterium]